MGEMKMRVCRQQLHDDSYVFMIRFGVTKLLYTYMCIVLCTYMRLSPHREDSDMWSPYLVWWFCEGELAG